MNTWVIRMRPLTENDRPAKGKWAILEVAQDVPTLICAGFADDGELWSAVGTKVEDKVTGWAPWPEKPLIQRDEPDPIFAGMVRGVVEQCPGMCQTIEAMQERYEMMDELRRENLVEARRNFGQWARTKKRLELWVRRAQALLREIPDDLNWDALLRGEWDERLGVE